MPGMASGRRATKISQRKPQIRINAATVKASTRSHEAGTAISMASAATAMTSPRVEAKDDGFVFGWADADSGSGAGREFFSGGRISKETSSIFEGGVVPDSLSDGFMV